MGVTAPRKTILDRNKVITNKVVSSREYKKRKLSPPGQPKTSTLLGIDGFEIPEGRVTDKGVKVYVLKQAEEAWAQTTKHE